MVSNKRSRSQASKVSSAAAPATTSTTQTAQKSSVLRSRFAPSYFQLSLFASVVQGLDGQRLRIHDTISGRLHCEHAIAPRVTVNCLDWGRGGRNCKDDEHLQTEKRRKRNADFNGVDLASRNVMVALGTSDSKIHLFSPSESKLIAVLEGNHTHGIRDFRFSDGEHRALGWSLGGDGKIIQWDLRKWKSIRTLRAPAHSTGALCPVGNSILCASHTAYLLDPASKEQPPSFTASSHAIHTILSSDPSSDSPSAFLTAADSEIPINVFDVKSRKWMGNILPEVEATYLALSSCPQQSSRKTQGEDANGAEPSGQILGAVNKDGIVELFLSPFNFDPPSSERNAGTMKERTKRMTRKAAATIKIVRPGQVGMSVPLLNMAFEGNDLVIAWAEGGINLVFDRVPWRDESTGKLVLQGVNELVKAKTSSAINGAMMMNGVKDMEKGHVDESRTVVANGGNVTVGEDPFSAIDISSGLEESEFSSEEDEGIEDEVNEMIEEGQQTLDENRYCMPPQPISQAKSAEDADIAMNDALDETTTGAKEVEVQGQQEAGEQSFGDLIRANADDTIDVRAILPSRKPQGLVRAGGRELQRAGGTSLGTVLSQALRTNDKDLLESCFHRSDLTTVRTTIERIDSSLASALLDRLAERLYSRPGRAGNLMVWIQWTLVAHGGYLASQKEVMKKLASLQRVVGERANSLQPLLSLKGKLDMLEAQINLRKSMQAGSRATNAIEGVGEEDVVYVEGQEESDSEDETGDIAQPMQIRGTRAEEVSMAERGNDSYTNSDDEEEGEETGEEEDEHGDDDEDEVDGMPTTNGVMPDSASEGSESEDEPLTDDEAESSEADSDEAGHEDVESSSEQEGAPPAKRLNTHSKFGNGTNEP